VSEALFQAIMKRTELERLLKKALLIGISLLL